jgi:hypothetical protein
VPQWVIDSYTNNVDASRRASPGTRMALWQRLDTRYGVALRADCVTRDTFVVHRVTNISRGGVFLEGTSLPVESELQLRIHLGDHDVLPVRARVVWNSDLKQGTPHYVRGMGMTFVALGGMELRRLNGYLKRLVAEPAPETPTTRN